MSDYSLVCLLLLSVAYVLTLPKKNDKEDDDKEDK